MEGLNSSEPTIQEPRKFFIIYKKDSAKTLAENIHDSLHRIGVDVFLDGRDLKEGLSHKEWKKQIDIAIEEAQLFIYIVTFGSTTSEDVRYELRQAKNLGKDIRVFIDNYIWDVRRETRIRLGRRFVDLKAFQVRRFDSTQPDMLFREVTYSIFITKIYKLSVEAVDENGKPIRVPFRFKRVN